MKEQKQLAVLPEGYPVSMFIGFTADDDRFFCRAIQSCTDGIWSHILVGFTWENGESVYYEALLAGGVSGPWPVKRLAEWRWESEKHRMEQVSLDFLCPRKAHIQSAWSRAQAAVGHQSYFTWQLLLMGISERYGLVVPRSGSKTVCSEFVALVCQDIIDLRDRRRLVIDQVNPNSAWRRLCEEKAMLGYLTRPPADPDHDSERSVEPDPEPTEGIGATA